MSTSSAPEPLFHDNDPLTATPAATSLLADVPLAPSQSPTAALRKVDGVERAARPVLRGLPAGSPSGPTDECAKPSAEVAAPLRKLTRPGTRGDRRAAQRAGGTAETTPATAPATTAPARTPAETARPMTLLQGGRGREATESQEQQQDATLREVASARQTARRHLPPPAEVAKDIALALFEVEAGYRSAAQLERVCTPELWDRLEGQVRRHGEPPPSGRKLIRVHYQELTPGVANTVAVIERGSRVQPVAMRLDARSGRWLVTELRY